MQEHNLYDDTRMKVFQSDLTQDELSTIIPTDSIDIVLLLFVLSSITPDKMTSVLINIFKVSSLCIKLYYLIACLRLSPKLRVTYCPITLLTHHRVNSNQLYLSLGCCLLYRQHYNSMCFNCCKIILYTPQYQSTHVILLVGHVVNHFYGQTHDFCPEFVL